MYTIIKTNYDLSDTLLCFPGAEGCCYFVITFARPKPLHQRVANSKVIFQHPENSFHKCFCVQLDSVSNSVVRLETEGCSETVETKRETSVLKRDVCGSWNRRVRQVVVVARRIQTSIPGAYLGGPAHVLISACL